MLGWQCSRVEAKRGENGKRLGERGAGPSDRRRWLSTVRRPGLFCLRWRRGGVLPVKVLHVYIDFDPDRGGGGVARHIAGLAALTVGPGFNIRVAAPKAERSAGRGFDVVVASWFNIAWQVGWADVVHIHGARCLLPAFAAFLGFLAGRRVVYTPHCYYDDDRGLKRIAKRGWDYLVERTLLRRSGAVILLAEYWRHYLAARGLPTARAVVLPNCVIGANVRALRCPGSQRLEGHPALLSVGRLDAVKRLDDALRVLTDRRLGDAVLHVVGRGPDGDRLIAMARELGISGRVRFYGFVADADVAEMAAGADAFVMPSAAEGMPTVLIEMILLGLPVVASDIPGNRAILDGLGLDSLFSVGDVTGMASVILRAVATPLAAEVVTRAAEHFTWEHVAPRVAALYGGSDA